MDFSQTWIKVVVALVAISIAFKVLGMLLRSKKEPLGLSRKDDIKMTLEELNGFKNGFSGSMDPERFRKQLDKKVREFEINNDVLILKSSIFAEGPIIIKDS